MFQKRGCRVQFDLKKPLVVIKQWPVSCEREISEPLFSFAKEIFSPFAKESRSHDTGGRADMLVG
jgi:hypothetical protein